MYCNILVTKPFDKPFTYLVKANQNIKRGNIVTIPFGKIKNQIGLVYEKFHLLPKEVKDIQIKEVNSLVKNICFNDNLIKLYL